MEGTRGKGLGSVGSRSFHPGVQGVGLGASGESRGVQRRCPALGQREGGSFTLRMRV